MTLDEMMKDVERRGYDWLIRTHDPTAYFAHIYGGNVGLDGYTESWKALKPSALDAFSQAYKCIL